MNPADPAPLAVRRLATVTLFASSILALAYLPTDDLPTPWLLAFTVPGAILGGWSRLAKSPWRRALLAIVLQAGACYGALEWVGPMTRPAALACTILPPLAFTTTRNHDHDPSLALFLSFCVLLVGVILDGWHMPLLIAYGVCAFLSLHVSTLLQGFRRCREVRRPVALRASDAAATSSMILSCLLALLAIERSLQCLPSPSSNASDMAGGGGGGGGGSQDKSVGLDDSFVLDGKAGMLSDLAGEQLVRVEAPDGEGVQEDTYLRCGFFTLPKSDRWDIGTLRLQKQPARHGHKFRGPSLISREREFAIERFGGASKFVFLPPHTLRLGGLNDLVIDQQREWVRPRIPDDTTYFVAFEELPPLPRSVRVADVTAMPELLALPEQFDRLAYEKLLRDWGVGNNPIEAMARIAEGLGRHCRYERATPVGPFQYEIDNFLFADGDRYGYCMHFAWAATIMLRMRGIPCRIGVGLFGGAPDRLAGARMFGSQNAHAWVEVAFAGRGFEIYDPTPSSMRGRGFVPSSTAGGLSDPSVEVERSALEPAIRAVSDFLTLPLTWAIALGLVLLVAILPRRAPRRPERKPAKTTSPQARRLLLRMLQALARAGHQRAPNQTLERFYAELEHRRQSLPEIRAALAAYQEIRFGGRPFDDERRHSLEQGARAARELATAEPDAGVGQAAGQT